MFVGSPNLIEEVVRNQSLVGGAGLRFVQPFTGPRALIVVSGAEHRNRRRPIQKIFFQNDHRWMIELTEKYFSLVNEVREQRAIPELGWTWPALEDLQAAVAIETNVAKQFELRSLAAEILSSFDLREIDQPLAVRFKTAALAFSPDGKHVAFGQLSSSGAQTVSVLVYDVQSREQVAEYSYSNLKTAFLRILNLDNQPKDGIRSLAYSSDGIWLAAGTRFGKIVVWDTRPVEPKQIECQAFGGKDTITHLSFSNNAALIFARAESGSCCRWDFEARSKQAEIFGFQAQALAFDHTREYLAYVQGDHLIVADRPFEKIENTISSGSPIAIETSDGRFLTRNKDEPEIHLFPSFAVGVEVHDESFRIETRSGDSEINDQDEIHLRHSAGSYLAVDKEKGKVVHIESPEELGDPSNTIFVVNTADGEPVRPRSKIRLTTRGGWTIASDESDFLKAVHLNNGDSSNDNMLFKVEPVHVGVKIAPDWPDNLVAIGELGFSPEGRRVANISYGLQLVNLPGGQVFRELWDPLAPGTYEYRSLNFSSDGRYLCAVHRDDDDSIRIWDTASGKPVAARVFPAVSRLVGEFSPDDKWLGVTGNKDAKLFEVRDSPMRCVTASVSEISDIHLSADGSAVWTLTEAKVNAQWTQRLKKRDVLTGAVLKESELRMTGGDRLGAAALSMKLDGSSHAFCLGESVVVGEHTLELPERLAPGPHGPICFSPDGSRLWTVLGGNQLLVWQGPDWTLASQWSNNNLKGRTRLHALDVGLKYAIASGHDEMLHIFDSDGGQPKSVPVEGGGVGSAAISSDEKFAAVGTVKGDVRLFKLPGGEEIASLNEHRQEVTSLVFSQDDETLISGSLDGNICVWKRVGSVYKPWIRLPSNGPVKVIRLSSDQRKLAVLNRDQSGVYIWDLHDLNLRLERLGIDSE
ncbi:MAG: WD40 repeat domain-containing protein [Planctomycetes bacterium]|nr:WD40 repeat domain-containing protein [Planctomycetota bacterium]